MPALVQKYRISEISADFESYSDLTLLFMAAEYHTGIAALGTASCAFGFVTAFLAYWAGAAALWSVATPIQVPMFPLMKPTKSA